MNADELEKVFRDFALPYDYAQTAAVNVKRLVVAQRAKRMALETAAQDVVHAWERRQAQGPQVALPMCELRDALSKLQQLPL